jgi:ribosomal protein S18 acetylase RimI-like enzyme
MIREIEQNEIERVINVHLKAFKGFFLTSLGENFLEVYYNAIRENKRGILLGYFENEQLVGFCAATSLSAGFNSYLVKENLIKFTNIGLHLLFTNPKGLIRLFKNFTKSNTNISDYGQYAELLSIGVDPATQGKGIGRALLTALEKEFKNQGVKELSLTTDFYNNEKTLNFYQSLNYEIMYDFIAYPNRRMYRLIKKLS